MLNPKWPVVTIGLVLALSLTGCARDGVPRMVDAGGYRVRMLLQGHGAPAVVFVSPGFGASLEAWARVQPKVSQFTRTVAYDRGGTWKSDPAPLPRDSAHIAAELHAALRKAGIKMPYVLVGSSLGGIHVRVFAHLYPDAVAGLVLVDPTPEDLNARIQAEEPVVWQRMREEQSEMSSEMKTETSSWSRGNRSEYESLDSNLQQARIAWPLPAVPVTLLTAMRADSAAGARVAAIKLELHEALVRRIPGAKHIVTSKSHHNMAMEEPDLIVGAIREVVEADRSAKR